MPVHGTNDLLLWLVGGVTKETSHEAHYSCNPGYCVDRSADCYPCAEQHGLFRDHLKFRYSQLKRRNDQHAETSKATYGQQQKALLKAHEIKCTAWSRQFIESGRCRNPRGRNTEVSIGVGNPTYQGKNVLQGLPPTPMAALVLCTYIFDVCVIVASKALRWGVHDDLDRVSLLRKD